MATSYHVHISTKCGHNIYEAVVERVYFCRSGFPYISSRRCWYVPVTPQDYDDYRYHRNQYRFRRWLMQQIKGVKPDEVERY